MRTALPYVLVAVMSLALLSLLEAAGVDLSDLGLWDETMARLGVAIISVSIVSNIYSRGA